MQDSAVNRPTHPIPAPPVGNHLISDTAKHLLQGHIRPLLADFGGLAAVPFSVCLLMLQKWAVR